MKKEVILKWIKELEKSEKEQIDIFSKYQKELPEIADWVQFFERLKKEFKSEIEKEKMRLNKLLEK